MSQTAVMTLTEFVTARLDEDKRAAGAVKPLGHNFDMGGRRQDERFVFGRMGYASEDGYPQRRPDGGEEAHFARWSPARVLAEVAAKRRIVELHVDMHADTHYPGEDPEDALEGVCEVCHDYARHDAAPWPCDTLRALASVYADHPHFDPSWA